MDGEASETLCQIWHRVSLRSCLFMIEMVQNSASSQLFLRDPAEFCGISEKSGVGRLTSGKFGRSGRENGRKLRHEQGVVAALLVRKV